MNSRTKILLKKVQTHVKSNFGKLGKSLLLNKETQVEIFFESVFGKSDCDCRCLHFWHELFPWEQCVIDFLCSHFWHDCCFLESSVSLILITMSLPDERLSYKEPSSPVGWMQSGLAALFVTPSLKKNDGDGNWFVDDKLINKGKPSSTTVAKGVLNNGEHTLIPVMAKMIHSAVWD